MDWFASDLHLGHGSILQYRTKFASLDKMNEAIISSFDPVMKGDRVFLLGDLGFDAEVIHKFLDKLLKQKIEVFWIQGNHDKDKIWKMDFEPWKAKYLHKRQGMTVKGYGNYHSLYLSHYPCLVWDKSHYGSYMIHGHGHTDTVDREILETFKTGHRLNVNIEFHDYKPWTRDEIEKALSDLYLPDNLDSIILKTIKEPEWQNFKPYLKDLFREINSSLDKFYEHYGQYQLHLAMAKANHYDKDDITESAVLYALQDPRD